MRHVPVYVSVLNSFVRQNDGMIFSETSAKFLRTPLVHTAHNIDFTVGRFQVREENEEVPQTAHKESIHLLLKTEERQAEMNRWVANVTRKIKVIVIINATNLCEIDRC